MRSFSSILTIGALLAFAGSVVAAPVPDAAPVPAKHIQTVWQTVTHTKIVGVTKTEWVDVPTSTPTKKTTSTTTTEEEETTTTAETSTTTTSTTTSTTESTTEEDYTTTTTSTTTTSSTTSTTTTEEETSTTDTPTPTQPKPTTLPIQIDIQTLKPTPTPTPEPQPTEPPQSESHSVGGWEGDATYFDPGMGSCGYTNGPGDLIAAISYQVMDPQNPGNPNNNPLCGKKIRCTRDGKNPTIITVTDRCPICKSGDLDLSPAAYSALGGTIAEGRFRIQCNWV